MSARFPAIGEAVRLRSGVVGTYRGICPVTGKHRVQTGVENARVADPVGITTWLLDDAGWAGRPGTPVPFDLEGAGQ